MKAGIRTLLLVCSFLWLSPLLATAQDVPPPHPASEGEGLYQTHCSMCHDTGAGHAPSKESLKQITPEAVVRALSLGGPMAAQGSGLTDDQRRTLARYVTGKDFGGDTGPPPQAANCTTPDKFDPSAGPRWDGWGGNNENTRFQPAADARLPVADVPKLKLKWAFAFPDALVSNTQPVVQGGRVFVSSWNGILYSLDASTGCIRWTFHTSAFVRSAPVLARPSANGPWLLYVGDSGGRAYALDAATGKQIWTAQTDDPTHFPKITGSVRVYGGRVFVPVTAMEEFGGATYECCKYSGRLIAYNAATGAKLWDTPTIFQSPHKVGVNSAGIAIWAPSGAGIWSAPTIDAKAGVVYATTGDNHSQPTTDTSDSIFALDMKTGKVLWHRQFTTGDAYNGGPVGCSSVVRSACPVPHGHDYDFGAPAILVSRPDGGRLLIGGQKSGVVHAVDPDRHGAVVWETRVARGGNYGGIEFGIAADGKAVYAPVSDIDTRDQEVGETVRSLLIGDRTKGGGLAALDLRTGREIWMAPPIPCPPARPLCLPAQTAPVSVIPGAVFSGSLDGHMRAYSTKDGKVLWDFDTVRAYDAVGGAKGKGGAVGGSGPAIVDGVVYTTSGDGITSAEPGNVLLAFSAK